MTNTVSIFPAFSSRFVDFEVQFCFRCKFSFHAERRTSQVSQWRDFLGPIKIVFLRIATSEIASFVYTIDNVKWLLSCLSKWAECVAKADFRVIWKDFEIKKSFFYGSLSLYFIKQIDSMLPCVWSVKDHRRRQDVARTSMTHSHFDVIYDLLLSRRMATWKLFVK